MVKTRRSNGENGDHPDLPGEGNEGLNDARSVSNEQIANCSPRELRSSQFKVKRKIQHWPNKYSRRLRTIKMPRIMFPESDTEPEKYSRRARQVRVFFAEGNESTNRSMKMKRKEARKNYAEDSEDKPIQQNVRRSCRKRKLLHHNFNESWITNELKVKGYPDLYGFPGSTSSDETSSGDEGHTKKLTRNLPPTNTDEDTQMSRRRTSARFNNSIKKMNEPSDSESDADNNQTVIEKKPLSELKKAEEEKMEVENQNKKEKEIKPDIDQSIQNQDSESNQVPARSTRRRGARQNLKKEDSQQETASETSSSESGSDMTLNRAPRRSNRTRNPKPAFVQIAQRETRGRAKTFTIRKKPYSLRERKPKMRRKTIRSQSPSSSSSTTSSSDTEEDLNVSMKNKTKGRQKTRSSDDKKTDKALRDIQPVEVDGSVGFASVGGLDEHIKCLREMVVFPLMYSEVFRKFGCRPAKGVLLHGPPGTGKTLLARALANECSRLGGRKLAFFVRKGADCLKKWVGESERHLKLLFQQANKMKPSIIFFDEIDALAPVRSVRQEQVHTSVVGTLLAEMDGLCDRGEVIIIGATNRLDAVDPALRRAGRFDRELYFGPPGAAARRDILRIHTRRWTPPLPEPALRHVAALTSGYGGSDIKALCSEAVLKALRRVYPQVYESEHALVIDSNNVEVTEQDLIAAMSSVTAACARAAPAAAARLPAAAAPLLAVQTAAAAAAAVAALPRMTGGLSRHAFLITGECAETYIAPAILADMEHCTVKELSVATLHSPHVFTQEQALISVFAECRRCAGGEGGEGGRGCVLVLREAAGVWRALAGGGGGGAALLLQLCRARAAGPATLLLATSALPYRALPIELQELFPPYKDCIYKVREPTASEVINFLKPIITEIPLEPPIIVNHEPPPPLPRAPPPPPPKESVEEISRRKRKEDYKLRELRIFLRDICRKLASNRRFYKFTKPVDLEEVTDYLDIVKQPMDLETMMTKVDMHKYNCAKDFLDDIDLICANALEYNPDRTSSDKQIRHEACSLRDHAHALIDVEMDSDFELECQDIAQRRRREGAELDHDLPDFIYTASNLHQAFDTTNDTSKLGRTPQNGDKSEPNSVKRKRRRINHWSKGMVVKRPRTSKSFSKDTSMAITDDDSKENKPITSTPLPNGDVTSSDNSEDDVPLKRPAAVDDNTREHDDSLFNISAQTQINNHVLESPTKSTDKSPTKNSPKKRNSGQETTSSDGDKVLINKTELENILYKNVKTLRCIGLEPLLDLHAQLSNLVSTYSDKYDRTKLPQEMLAIVSRYLQISKK